MELEESIGIHHATFDQDASADRVVVQIAEKHSVEVHTQSRRGELRQVSGGGTPAARTRLPVEARA